MRESGVDEDDESNELRRDLDCWESGRALLSYLKIV